MLVIRFSRRGKKNAPTYRIVLIEKKRAAQSGGFLEILGSYDPRQKEANLETERIKYWLGQGAQASDSVYNLLVRQGAVEGPRRPKKIKAKDRGEKPEEKTEEKAVEEGGEEALEKPAKEEKQESENKEEDREKRLGSNKSEELEKEGKVEPEDESK